MKNAAVTSPAAAPPTRKKLHLGVDAASVIVVHTLTEATVGDATTGVDLIEAVHSDLTSVTAGAAYDTVAFYEAACAPGRNRRRAAGEDAEGVSTPTAVGRARPDNHERRDARAAPVEEGVR